MCVFVCVLCVVCVCVLGVCVLEGMGDGGWGGRRGAPCSILVPAGVPANWSAAMLATIGPRIAASDQALLVSLSKPTCSVLLLAAFPPSCQNWCRWVAAGPAAGFYQNTGAMHQLLAG